MKAIFKLKEVPYNYENEMTLEQATECYAKGKLPFTTYWGSGETRVPNGFYLSKLTFEQWLTKYNIKAM